MNNIAMLSKKVKEREHSNEASQKVSSINFSKLNQTFTQ